MADIAPSSTPIVDADLAAADRQAEQLAQSQRDNPALSERPNVDPARENELDRHLDEVLASTNADGNAPKPADPAAEPAAAEPAPPVANEPAAEPAADPATPKGPLDDLLANATAKPAGEADPVDDIKLRSDASPKTRETFEQLKTVYKGRLDAANAKALDLETRLKELETKAANPLTDDLKKELEDHRAFRAQFDTENDPTFKQKFDTRVSTNYQDIYARLSDHRLPDTELEKLKAMPSAERDAAIDTFLDKLPPGSRRFIESKLIDNQSVQDQRRKELTEVRAKADQILAEKAKAPQDTAQRRLDEVTSIMRPVLAQLPFVHVQEIPATAGAEERKALESRNAFALSAQEMLRRTLLDDSPQARSDAALALPLAHYYKREYDTVKAQLAAATERLDGITKAGRTSRTANSIASPNRPQTPVSGKTQQDSGDAVDSLFNELQKAGGVL